MKVLYLLYVIEIKLQFHIFHVFVIQQAQINICAFFLFKNVDKLDDKDYYNT